ncbi:unnamed protein product, partial [Musa banksii]
TPGTFTNQLQTSFSEPRLLFLTDPRTDHQPIKESALGNIRTIAFCNTDSLMRYVDIGIPANNKGKPHIGCLFWLLTRMGLQMRGTIAPGHKWEVMLWGTLKRPKSRKRLKLLWHLNMVLLLSTLVWYQLISGLPSNGHLI